jgi:hypothetical protein
VFAYEWLSRAIFNLDGHEWHVNLPLAVACLQGNEQQEIQRVNVILLIDDGPARSGASKVFADSFSDLTRQPQRVFAVCRMGNSDPGYCGVTQVSGLQR